MRNLVVCINKWFSIRQLVSVLFCVPMSPGISSEKVNILGSNSVPGLLLHECYMGCYVTLNSPPPHKFLHTFDKRKQMPLNLHVKVVCLAIFKTYRFLIQDGRGTSQHMF